MYTKDFLTYLKKFPDENGYFGKFGGAYLTPELENAMKEIALLAPTGRASKRMTESTNLQASTIHRFLKWNKETNKFAVDEFNPDKSKFIIIDEMSMLEISLLDSLFKGLTNNIQIVFVGDYNQLPSGGPGQVLKDLIESEVIDTIHLDLLYRQDENSYINTLAIEIKNNDLAENFMETKSDYTFLDCSSSMIKESLKKICKQIITQVNIFKVYFMYFFANPFNHQKFSSLCIFI